MDDDELTKWEYTIEDVRRINQEKMNQLGAQGWELSGISAVNGGGSNNMIFKRKQRTQQNQNNGFSYSR